MSQIYLNGLIIGSIVFVVPLLVTLIFYFFNIKLNAIKITYLYAFITGLLLVLAIFGFINEAKNLLFEYYQKNNLEINNLMIVVIIASGAIIGVVFGILTKWIYTYRNKKANSNLSINKQSQKKFHDKLMSIIFLLIHNLIDGIILGFLLYDSGSKIFQIENIGLLIAFVLHLIPTTICIYYINILKTNNKRNSFLLAISSNLIIVPFIFVGITITHYAINVYWLFPFLLSATSGSLIFVSIIDFSPEFLTKYSLGTKEWISMTVFITIGIFIGLVLSIIQN